MTYRMRLYLHRMHALDSSLCIRVNHASQYLWVRWLFRLISRLGDGVFWYTLMCLLILTQGQQGATAALHMALVGIAGTLLYKWLKGKTLRPRPYEVHQDIWLTGRPLDRFSFPSGHTLHAVGFCTVALAYYPALAPVLLPFTILVGMSRVVLGLHYPSDVLAGATLGGLIATATLLLLA
ncbi:phosphatase PAP2 family protein [Methylobacillus flagellatus]|uniref:phosphatase PAP2 family protein n=1 Tax=Methylobacillus flagellatus TaxID=405 RepID=UPI00256FD52A|nr:phosphatase PAP2 family protein [Methylobacillus flagellatus]